MADFRDIHCPECGKEFSDLRGLNGHLRMKHQWPTDKIQEHLDQYRAKKEKGVQPSDDRTDEEKPEYEDEYILNRVRTIHKKLEEIEDHIEKAKEKEPQPILPIFSGMNKDPYARIRRLYERRKEKLLEELDELEDLDVMEKELLAEDDG